MFVQSQYHQIKMNGENIIVATSTLMSYFHNHRGTTTFHSTSKPSGTFVFIVQLLNTVDILQNYMLID